MNQTQSVGRTDPDQTDREARRAGEKRATATRSDPQAARKARGSSRRLLTDAEVSALERGKWLLESLGRRGLGRLAVRGSSQGRPSFFYRFVTPKGERATVALGVYDKRGRGGITLAVAREAARTMALKHQAAHAAGRDLRDVLADERRAALAKVEAERIELDRIERESKRGTLRELLDAYVAHLTVRGKPAAADARRMFKRHVFEAWPDLASKRAASVRPAEITAILRRVVQAGSGRTAAKLRSFLGAAYSLALRAEHDAAAPAELLAFGIETNPAAVTAALSQFNRARDRALTESELAFYASAVEAAPESPQREAARLALLLGGQRVAQLLRVTRSDVDLQARTITLRDAKGRRTEPRRHVLPLTDVAAAIVAKLLAIEHGHRRRATAEAAPEAVPLFTAHGTRATRPETVEALASAIFEAMQSDPLLAELKACKGSAQLRDVRRTCETHLAALGIPRDVRAQLQSHGLGGIQARHYDRHEYMREKREALEAWAAYLDRIKRERAAALEAKQGKRKGVNHAD